MELVLVPASHSAELASQRPFLPRGMAPGGGSSSDGMARGPAVAYVTTLKQAYDIVLGRGRNLSVAELHELGLLGTSPDS